MNFSVLFYIVSASLTQAWGGTETSDRMNEKNSNGE